MPLPGWMDDAACAGHDDPDLWFATDADSIAEAAGVCATCPVTEPCAAYAGELGIRYGVWGGRPYEAPRRPAPLRRADFDAAAPRIREMAAAGATLTAISDRLAADGIRPAPNARWHEDTIARVLATEPATVRR